MFLRTSSLGRLKSLNLIPAVWQNNQQKPFGGIQNCPFYFYAFIKYNLSRTFRCLQARVGRPTGTTLIFLVLSQITLWFTKIYIVLHAFQSNAIMQQNYPVAWHFFHFSFIATNQKICTWKWTWIRCLDTHSFLFYTDIEARYLFLCSL